MSFGWATLHLKTNSTKDAGYKKKKEKKSHVPFSLTWPNITMKLHVEPRKSELAEPRAVFFSNVLLAHQRDDEAAKSKGGLYNLW